MGVSASLSELYDASYGRLVIQAFAFCGDMAEAEDAVQEAFVKAIGLASSFDRVERPEAWLRTVAFNHLRSRWRHATVVRRFAADVPGSRSVPELTPDHVAIVRALSELDGPQRQVVVMRYLADLGPAEIAHELGLAEGTVKSRLSRARERLAPLLDDREEADRA